MSAYTVVFEMPPHIAEGIRAGALEVIGGVVRMVRGKQVVMWLRPGLQAGEVLTGAAAPLSLLAGGVALSTAMATGGVLVTAVTFGLLSAQVAHVERQLEGVLSIVGRIDKTTTWLKHTILGLMRQKLGAAFLVAETIEANGDFDALMGPLGEFEAARAFYADQMRALLAEEVPLAFAPVFIEFAMLYILATGAKARALTLLRGEDEARHCVGHDAETYGQLRAAMLAPLDDPEAGLIQLTQLSDDEEEVLCKCLPALPPVAAVEYMRLPGLQRDIALLDDLRKVSVPAPGEAQSAVIVNAMMPA